MKLQEFVMKSAKHYDTRLTEVEDDLGPKPDQFEPRFDSTNLWGTIGEIASFCEFLEENSSGQEVTEDYVKNLITAKSEFRQNVTSR